jgi:DNA-binding CsgD family transcriptional regulator
MASPARSSRPAYLPGGVIGAAVWATDQAGFEAPPVFEARAAGLHALALRFVATYADAVTWDLAATPAARLTRREIKRLKWAAAGKTDGEIGGIMRISLPAVRFHITNASRKLGADGRSQAIRRAAVLGYVGAAEPVGSVRPHVPN